MGSEQSTSRQDEFINQQKNIIQEQQQQIRQLSQMNLPLQEPPKPKPKIKLDPYKILSISKNYDEVSLKRAYLQAALKTHPDRGGDPIIFRKVSLSYAVLKKKLTDKDTFREHQEFKDESREQMKEQKSFQHRQISGDFDSNLFNSGASPTRFNLFKESSIILTKKDRSPTSKPYPQPYQGR